MEHKNPSNQLTMAQPIRLPCGTVLSNRFIKAAMSEGLADPFGRPDSRLINLYRYWGKSGAAVLLTGNVMIDDSHLEVAGNLRIQKYWNDKMMRESYAELANASQENGCQCWLQLSHAGRNTDPQVNITPFGPSAERVKDAKYKHSQPVPMTKSDIEEVVAKFVSAAKASKHAGFKGIQIHGAHGYLLSSFLNPLANTRTDEFGGSLENRAKPLLMICDAIRTEVGPNYPIGVKLNSADFQQGGSTVEDAVKVAAMLDARGVDVIEISGGNMENMSMMGLDGRADSTKNREGYFLEYALEVRKVVKHAKLMVTGGFRTKQKIEEALSNQGVDLIGLGRPFLYMSAPARNMIDGKVDKFPSYENDLGLIPWYLRPLTLFMNQYKLATILSFKFIGNMIILSEGRALQENFAGLSFGKMIRQRSQALRELQGVPTKGTVHNKERSLLSSMPIYSILAIVAVAFTTSKLLRK